MQNIAIPVRYNIYLQDLSKDYLALSYIGFVNNINEARAMCRVFNETDIEVKNGNHSYLFVCAEIKQ